MFSVAVSVDEGLAQHVCDGEPALSAHPEKRLVFLCVCSNFFLYGAWFPQGRLQWKTYDMKTLNMKSKVLSILQV